MDTETLRSMRLAMLAVASSFIISLIAYAFMASFRVHAYADYDNFIRILIVATMIDFIVLPVLLTFFVNDAGELENFTKSGPMEKAWLVNAIGVIALIVAGALLGYALASFYTGWSEPEPGSIFGPALMMMTWAMFIQSLGFSVPLFYFMISKRLAREVIPFKKNELISDIIGIVFSLLLPIAPAVLVVSPIYSTILASIFGILAFGVGFVWMIAYYLAIKVRELPDIPEDSESANTSEDS